MQEFPFSCNICVPPMATVYFEYDKILPPPETPKRVRKVAAGHGAQAPEAAAAPVEKPKRTRKKKEEPSE